MSLLRQLFERLRSTWRNRECVSARRELRAALQRNRDESIKLDDTITVARRASLYHDLTRR